MNAVAIVMVAMLCLGSGWAVAGDTLKVPNPPKVSDAVKNAAVGAGSAMLFKPCVAGKPKDGKAGSAGSAICNEVASQLAASLSTQTAPSAKNIGAIAKVAVVDAASATLSKPCTAGMPKDGKAGSAGSAICNEVASQLAASLSTQTAPSAKNIGAIAKVAVVDVASATLSKPCVAGTTTSGKAGSAACKEVAAQLAASLSTQTAPSAKNIGAGMQAAASSALTASAGQKISQMLTGSQQPIVGDLLTLGLKRQFPAGANGIGTFAPPGNSALPIGTDGLRTGLSIISNDKGKAGLGMKSEVELGSQKFEISGSLDPNSSSDQGKSAGVQIKIGGD